MLALSQSDRRICQSPIRHFICVLSYYPITNSDTESGRALSIGACVSTPFRVHRFQGDTISLKSRKRIFTHSSITQRWILLIFSIYLLVSIFNREIFSPYFFFIFFFYLTLNRLLDFLFFIFNVFFFLLSSGWFSWDCVGFSGVHFVKAVRAAQNLAWSSYHNKDFFFFAFIFPHKTFSNSFFRAAVLPRCFIWLC